MSQNPFADPYQSPQPLPPQFALAPLQRVIPSWMVYTAVLTAIGSLLLRALVWSPVLREFATSPQASLITVLIAAPTLGWTGGDLASGQSTRPLAQANGPPHGDRQALLQVFRL